MSPAVMWFRRDLRTFDHPALSQACANSDKVIPLFILDPTVEKPGTLRTELLYHALHALRDATKGALVVRRGAPHQVVPEVAHDIRADAIYLTAEPTPFGRRRDGRVREACNHLEWHAIGTPYAIGPGTITTKSDTGYKVFTPFSKAWANHGFPDPAQSVDLSTVTSTPGRDDLPHTSPCNGIEVAMSQSAASDQWHDFLGRHLDGYSDDRNRPDLDQTSRLSIALKYGLIHPRTLLADLAHVNGLDDDVRAFRNELAWREFHADVLWRQPEATWRSLRDDVPSDDINDRRDDFEAWCSGHTGFPMVDAGMRQLRAEGYMHGRTRMITASFLTKDLHLHWRHGERVFMDLLADGDTAQNALNWQWVAGTGYDAAPYFRVFNPVSQGIKFDPDGDYVRRWVPELSHLAGKAAHEPWKHATGYDHGYPQPLVNHNEERDEALNRYHASKD